MSGVRVTFAVTGGDGSITGDTTVTNGDGVASVGSWTLGTTPGMNTLAAMLAGLTGSPATFTATSIVIDSIDVLTLASVSAGDDRMQQDTADHTCGLTSLGVAYCWGLDFEGELGDGTRTGFAAVAVAGGLTFQSLSAGMGYTCGLTTGGAAYCWGFNSDGELGDGTNTGPNRCSYADGSSDACSSTPVPVSSGLTFQSLTAGGGHTCGLTTGGSAYCWGSNARGQLGDGTAIDRLTPTLVATGLTFRSVTAGEGHTCGLTLGGTVYCWGSNGHGELGDGTTADRLAPVSVSGGLTFRSVAAGGWSACGITDGGSAYCWGSNFYGELGLGAAGNQFSTPVAVLGGLSFRSLAVGGSHSCGVTSGGSAYCWGGNWHGELGDGTMTSHWAPVAVSGGLTFQSVTVGGSHTCGVTTGGSAYCWGFNGDYELGAPPVNGQGWSPTPVAVRRP